MTSLTNTATLLLRVGIDRDGRLDLNILWDIAVRAAVIVDLIETGVVTDDPDSSYEFVDTDQVRDPILDTARQQLLSGEHTSIADWITNGDFSSTLVASRLVRSGEWTTKYSLMSANRRTYRARRDHIAHTRTQMAALVDMPDVAVPVTDRTVAYLLHILTGIAPVTRNDRHPDDCVALLILFSADIQSILRYATRLIRSRMTTGIHVGGDGG